MKIFLLLLLLSPLCVKSAGKVGYDVFERKGVMYAVHKVEPNQSLTDISKAYFVSIEILAGANNLTSQSVVEAGQTLLIPLLETNYFKMSGISDEQPGFYPLLYTRYKDRSLEEICAHFGVQSDAFMKWNQLSDMNEKSKTRLIIGWVKYVRDDETASAPSIPIARREIKRPSEISKNEKQLKGNAKTIGSDSSFRESNARLRSNEQELKAKEAATLPGSRQSSTKSEPGKAVSTTGLGLFKKASNKKEDSLKQVVLNRQRKRQEQHEYIKRQTTPEVMQSNAPTKDTTQEKNKIKYLWSGLGDKLKTKRNPAKEKVQENIAPSHAPPVVSKTKPASQPVKQAPLSSSKPYAYKTANVIPTRSPVNKKNTVPATGSKTADSLSLSTQPDKSSLATTNSIPVIINAQSKSISNQSKQEASTTLKQVGNTSNLPPSSTSVTTPVELPEDKTVRNEIKPLSLLNAKQGKCAFYFSGPASRYFYAFTNLAGKGEIIKVINLANGKFVMAEVVGELPNSDSAKGLLIKLGDNAKMPLGQNHNTFQVKVNY